jgi:hypothetical protein
MRILTRLAIAASLILVTAGCIASGTLGGRQTCWPQDEHRAPSLWRGTLRIDATGGRLDTPEGDVIPLRAGALAFRVGDAGMGELIRGSEVVARTGDDVTLFGGAGSDGVLVVCAVEEQRGPAS